MKRLFKKPFVLFVAAAFVAAASAVAARPLDEVTRSGRITIFVYKDYPPYSWKEDGQIKGIDADIARAIARDLSVELDFLVREADENVDDDLRVNVWKGDIIQKRAADIMLHVPYDRTLEVRAESLAVLFSPYFGEEIAVVFDKDHIEKVETFGRFLHNAIAVEVDTAADFFLSNAFQGQLQKSVRRGRYFRDAVQMLEDNDVAALMASRAQAEWVRSRNPQKQMEIAQPPMPGIVRSHWPIGIAVKENSRDLGYAVTDIISALAASGELDRIFAHYGVAYVAPKID